MKKIGLALLLLLSCATVCHAQSNSFQTSALGHDTNWQARVMALAMQYAAATVYVEDPATQNHAIRLNFAKLVINGGGANIPLTIANGTNIISSTITYDFTDGHVKTDATDAAISSQIASYWNMLAGV